MPRRPDLKASVLGFTLPELLIVLAVFATFAALGLPLCTRMFANLKLGAAARSVQSELQAARLRAVSNNRPLRVRFNCPAAGQFRIVALIGTPSAPAAADSSENRCSPEVYPFPAANPSPLWRPNLDGPPRYLDSGVSFTSSTTIEFWADGTAHADSGAGTPWPAIVPQGVSVTLAYGDKTRSITVNGVGKVSLQ
jgi:prepilin-type N-terminal cleavage/methylation domain-containing protein